MPSITRKLVTGMILGLVVIAVFLVTMTARAQQLTADSPGNAAAAPAASAPLPALPAAYVPASQIVRYSNPNKLFLRSSVALIMDEREGVILHGRNIDRPRPIASLTKLMTVADIDNDLVNEIYLGDISRHHDAENHEISMRETCTEVSDPGDRERCERLLEPDYDIVAMVSNGKELVATAAEIPADLIIVDISMPGLNGIGRLTCLTNCLLCSSKQTTGRRGSYGLW